MHLKQITLLVSLILGSLFFAGEASGQQGATDGEWRSYGADTGSTKYSPLDQITQENFEQLEIGWRWQSVDALVAKAESGGTWFGPSREVFDVLAEEDAERWDSDLYGERPGTSLLIATPLMVDGLLYLSTPLYQAAAIDARTGKTIWIYDPKAYESGTPAVIPWRHRGVAYWENNGDARIVWATGDGFLIAVDAKTGRPAKDFGDGGRIDLMDGIPRAERETRTVQNLLALSSQSPPLVLRDTVIVGSSMTDMIITKEMPPGWVRAYDVRTGRHKWDFHTIPQSADEYGADTWGNQSWRYSGATNVWSMMSGDEELGYVYLPTGTPTGDYYGGHRPGDNLFAESLVCVDIETGQRVWHFQAVHHGLWDYDFASAPNLMDIVVDGRPIKAVAQVSKQGFVYTFDRVTGQPVWPIEERPVPTDTDLEGEVPSPTQPFPTRPAPFEYQGTSIDDLVDFTPEIRALAIEAVKGFRLGPLYTPNSTQGTLIRPTVGGGANWSGAAVDPDNGMLYVPSINGHSVIPFADIDPNTPATMRYIWKWGEGQGGPVMPRGLPLWKPPYSRMTAIDMNSGDHEWMTPLGDGDRIRNLPMLRDLNLPPLGGDGRGGPLLTKTLLINALTAGGSDGGPRLVAYDKATGEIIGSVDLPGGALGTPMTYMLDGQQYIGITVGGRIPELIVFRLPS
tara:strand:- start:3895 stop:5937 length:2043 start_codon:yes stop_codon:yes gene_type:complete